MATRESGAGRLRIDLDRLRLYAALAVALFTMALFFGPREPQASGLPLIAAGLGIRLWASGHLAKNEFLATTGPYRYVRHPLYLGTLVAFLGIPFVAGIYWLVPVVIAVVLPPYYWRIATEERALRQRFGESYQEYARAVPALVPIPWRRMPASSGNAFSWRRAVIENGWYKNLLYALVGLVAVDLIQDVLHPAVSLGQPLAQCWRNLLDFTQVFRTGRF